MKIKILGKSDLVYSVDVNFHSRNEQIDVIINVKSRSTHCHCQGGSMLACDEISYNDSVTFFLSEEDWEDFADVCEVILVAENEIELEIIKGAWSVSIDRGQFIFYFMKFDDYQIRRERMVSLAEFTNHE